MSVVPVRFHHPRARLAPIVVLTLAAVVPVGGASAAAASIDHGPVAPAPVARATASSSAPAGDETIWPGWRVLGPATSVDAVGAGADGTTFALSRGEFETRRGDARLVGRLPADLATGAGSPSVLPSGRLVLRSGDVVGTSDDLGRTWRSTTLPGDRTPGGYGPIFTDDRHGIVVAGSTPPFDVTADLPPGARSGPAVWGTDDGGRTWRTVVAAEPGPAATRADATPRAGDPGPPEPLPRVTVTAAIASGNGGYLRSVTIDRAAEDDEAPGTAIERSDDGGATWRRLWTERLRPGRYSPVRITSLGILPDRRIVASTDTEAGVAPVPGGPVGLLVVDPETGVGTDVAAPGPSSRVFCPRASPCLVGTGDATAPSRTRPFDGTTFGAVGPALPESPSSPAPGRVVGIGGTPATGLRVVRSDDGGRSYAPAIPTRPTALFDDHHVVVQARDDAWAVSRDGVRFATLPVPPTARALRAVAVAPGGLVALFSDDSVWRVRAGTWSRLTGAGVSAGVVQPETIAWSGGAVVVSGARGVARIAGRRLVREIRSDGRGRARGISGASGQLTPEFSDLSVAGEHVVAWSRRTPGQIAHSTDGGRTWRRLRALPRTSDVQLLSPRTILALDRTVLRVSRDGGRTFREAGSVDAVVGATVDVDPGSGSIAFRSRREGIVTVPSVGAFVTRDGGRTFDVLPRPGGSIPFLARPTTGGGILSDGPMGTLMASPDPDARLRPTRLALRVASVARAPAGRVRVRLTGRAIRVPEGADLGLMTARRPGATVVVREGDASAVGVGPGGAFATTVTLRPGRVIRLRYRGEFDVQPTRASSLSGWVRAPRRPRG